MIYDLRGAPFPLKEITSVEVKKIITSRNESYTSKDTNLRNRLQVFTFTKY